MVAPTSMQLGVIVYHLIAYVDPKNVGLCKYCRYIQYGVKPMLREI